MWRVPVSPPIPIYTREVGDEFSTFRRTRKTAQVLYNAPAGAVELTLACPVGFRLYLRHIIVSNTGGGPVTLDMTYFDKSGNAYAYWSESSGAVGNVCIFYGEACDTGITTGTPPRWSRPLGISMLYENETLELSMTTGAADVGNITIHYDEVKEFD